MSCAFPKQKTVGLMGIVNVTPDSFSDGGDHLGVEKALTQALSLQADGADILDIGGESTRPNSQPVSAEEEASRVMPLLERLLPHPHRQAKVSLDTYKASVAAKALALSSEIIINDVGGLTRDPAMLDVVAQYKAPVVIMQGYIPLDPQEQLVEAHLMRFFESILAQAVRADLPERHMMLDIGIGFGKTFAQNILALQAVPALVAAFRLPVLVGASRKSMIGQILDQPDPQKRLYGTLAVHQEAITQGATWLRVHDVKAHRDYLQVHQMLREGSPVKFGAEGNKNS